MPVLMSEVKTGVMKQSDYSHPFFAQPLLIDAGLNLHAVLALDALPQAQHGQLHQACDELHRYRQLVVIGHGGRDLWQAVSPRVAAGDLSNPIDEFTVDRLQHFFSSHAPEIDYQILYPGPSPVPLQRIGALLGWHHDSPFKIGINQQWGSWFAYRALLLIDAALTPSKPLLHPSPCDGCVARPCISSCPADAMEEGDFNLQRCIAFRTTTESRCRKRCVARLACPVAEQHRYSDEQMRYHYARSLRVIEASGK